MWDPITDNIHLSGDVAWLDCIFHLPKTLSLLPKTATAPTVTCELGAEVEDVFPEIIPAGENDTDNAENDTENNDEEELSCYHIRDKEHEQDK